MDVELQPTGLSVESSPTDHPVNRHIAAKETSADESNVWADWGKASLRLYLGFVQVKAHD